MSALAAGSVFAGLRIEAPIGRGGMGMVYRAIDPVLERQVALKVIAPDLSGDEEFRVRFRREARLAASLRHPSLVTVFGAGEHEGLLYVTMLFVEGGDLRRLIGIDGGLMPGRAAGLLAQVAAALDLAHDSGLVHRDVKPANILVELAAEGAEHAYLADFGLARMAVRSSTDMTRPGSVLGTLDYIAPEQLAGGPIDRRADVYALACVLYEALTGEVPFPTGAPLAKMFAHSSAEPPAPSLYAPGVPSGLDSVVRRGMAKDPDLRYQTAGDLAEAALAAASGEDVAAPPAETAHVPDDIRELARKLAGEARECDRCGARGAPVMIAGESYCGECGNRLAGAAAPEAQTCPRCGSTEPAALVAGVPHCAQCGGRLEGAAS